MEYLLTKTQELKRQRLLYEVGWVGGWVGMEGAAAAAAALPCLSHLFPHHPPTHQPQQQQLDKADEAEAALEDEKEKEAQAFIHKQTIAASTLVTAKPPPAGAEDKREKYIASVCFFFFFHLPLPTHPFTHPPTPCTLRPPSLPIHSRSSTHPPINSSIHPPTHPQQLSKAIHSDKAARQAAIKTTSYWLPSCTPEAKDVDLDKVGRWVGG